MTNEIAYLYLTATALYIAVLYYRNKVPLKEHNKLSKFECFVISVWTVITVILTVYYLFIFFIKLTG